MIQGIPLNRNAWHSGNGTNETGDRKSMSVEICYPRQAGAQYRAEEALTIKLVAQLLKERGRGVNRIREHRDWIGKYCSHRILSEASCNGVKAGQCYRIKTSWG
ncbi:N-acetylmuramoyl-L-alanine amidase [Bacillus velezensis]|uniref:N-acetylmuramoyl-L-alanine amidase n=1 Tax=Bacillus velezensis TaxID=492670 RepID=UPI00210657B7|nr:N-acetylmuramoyl-L-alanine amidase [Bacillus velezensis]UTY67958.1 N-acetylmuramoyl-L-alanine amidase [Bacillus velezensis]